jgi:hypothetical protein
MALDVLIEHGTRRSFAAVLDWPGWCRSAKDEEAALTALVDYAPRYEKVAEEAGLELPAISSRSLKVVERVPGGATTDFGAPEKVASADIEPLTPAQGSKHVALLRAAWQTLDTALATAPAALRKGPRGGGRDRDAIGDHVVGAEVAYARKLGVRMKVSAYSDRIGVKDLRDAIVACLTSWRDGEPLVEKGWPPRYAIRRIAWHALDHAWEVEDRTER